jgi:hypothetical protein
VYSLSRASVVLSTLMDDDTSLLALTSRYQFNGILLIVAVLLVLDHALP